MKKTTFWIIGGVIGLWLLLKLKMASVLQYTFAGISIGNGTILNPQLLISINIFNPTNTSSTINSINANIYSNASLIGTVSATYNQSIASNATTTLQLPLNLQLGGLLQDIATTIQQTGATFEIKGTVTADLIPVPLDITYNF
jgi:LEA14-like dessication related protein